MKILFCTDLSEPRAVTDTVTDLARRMDATLLVLHVIGPHPEAAETSYDLGLAGTGLTSYSVFDQELAAEFERAEFEAFQQFLAERFETPVRAAVRHGDPAQSILEDADEEEVALIVLGKHHRGALERFFLGGIGQKVLKHAKRPTLFVPLPEDD